MNLRSERLELIELTWNDLDLVHRLNSFPEVDQYNTLGIPKNIEETKKSMAAGMEDQNKSARTQFAWGIWFHKEFVGKAGLILNAKKYQSGEIYYVLDPAYWHVGIATETAKTIIRYGFEDLNLHRLTAGVATENLASIRVLEKVGMIREGIGRKILPIRGNWVDNFSYSILEEDPRDY